MQHSHPFWGYSQSSQPFRTHTQRSRLKDSKNHPSLGGNACRFAKKNKKQGVPLDMIQPPQFFIQGNWFGFSKWIFQVSGSRGKFTLLRAGESKMPTHQILMGSPNPKKLEDWMVFTQFHITIGFQKPATCRQRSHYTLLKVPLDVHRVHFIDSNDVSDLLQNSIASKDPEKSLLLWSVPEVPPKQNVCGKFRQVRQMSPKNHEFRTPFQPISALPWSLFEVMATAL